MVGIYQVAVIGATGLLFIILSISVTIRLNEQIGWLTPVFFLWWSSAVPLTSPWDLSGELWKTASNNPNFLHQKKRRNMCENHFFSWQDMVRV